MCRTTAERAATWGRPYRGKQTGSVGSAKPGAEVEPHQRQFLQTQGPVARKESRKATQILRAGNIAKPDRYASPVMGSGESGPMDLGGAKRSRSPSDASPGAFCLLCRHGQSNSPPAGGEIPLRKEPSSGPMRASGPTKKRSIIAPSSVTASPCHLPLKGKAGGWAFQSLPL